MSELSESSSIMNRINSSADGAKLMKQTQPKGGNLA